MKKKISVILLSVIVFSGFSQSANLIIPSAIKREQIIHHKAYSLSYSSAYVLPYWLSYKVTNWQVDKSKTVKGRYTADPEVTTRSASKKDYKQGGYLMVQLYSYLDLDTIDGVIEESFYMTNIVPMKQAFYRHIWLKIEDLTRLWVKEHGSLNVITAPILAEAPFSTMGENKVSIPKHFYKIIYDSITQNAIGFIVKNGTFSGSLKSYSHSVSEIEMLTGINFFPDLVPSEVKTLKDSVNYEFWRFDI